MRTFCNFLFFNELDILEIKLNELWNTVDAFIIQESSITHSGLPKPLYFKENYKRFSKYFSKIIHVEIPSDYNFLSYNDFSNYCEENYNSILFKIKNNIDKSDWFDKNVNSYFRDTFEKEYLICNNFFFKDNDIIIVGDCDEIPRKTVIENLKKEIDDDVVYHLEHDNYWYYYNLKKLSERWFGNIVTKYKNFEKHSYTYYRTYKNGDYKRRNLYNAGWHFTYMGGLDNIIKKIKSWGEQSLNKESIIYNLQHSLTKGIYEGFDIFGRPSKFQLVEITPESHPEYLYYNQEKFIEGILK
ncbi:MAG: hypothetical protein KatS3mg002_1015 [Candidatus Woesearchaeota archaeon]|nr:MAG: hypothetical protein KatS3mg002_1015 [Candidatus Woesearchaeota archaeon]